MSDLSERLAGLSPEKRALLTKRLQEKRATEFNQTKIPIRGDKNVYPLSYAQQRLWFLDQFEPNSAFYNVPSAIRLRGSLDVDALENSLNDVIIRHEVLRAKFITKDGQPVQLIEPEIKLGLQVIDLTSLSGEEQDSIALRIASEEANVPFELSSGPLIRAKLLRLGSQDHIFLLTIHHIVFDGWSNGILVQEIAALYEAYTGGGIVNLPKLEIQYADYAQWQRNWLKGDVYQQQISYWVAKLGELPEVLELPTDRPRPPVQTYHGGHYKFDIAQDLVHQIKQFTLKHNLTQYVTILAAYQSLLFRYSGQTDITVGSPIANRGKREIENLIGLFTNMIVLRSNLSGDPSFSEFVQRVREVAFSAQSNQDIPFEMLVDELRVERDLSRSPLFQAALVYQNAPMVNLQLGNLELDILETDIGTVKIDLSLVVEEGSDSITCTFRYNTDLFDHQTIERMAEHFIRLIESGITNPDRPISELSLLNPKERTLILETWNNTRVQYPEVNNIAELFESQVSRTPGSIAIHFPQPYLGSVSEESITYYELNRQANKLARYLSKVGVGTDSFVGIYLQRSINMIVALLAVQKAGAAYVPLSPDYPAERINYILDDTQLSIVLTHSSLSNKLKKDGIELINLDYDWGSIDQELDENLEHIGTPDNLAYVIYTSGSTGQAKGVLVKQRGLINHALSMVDKYDLVPGDRILQFITLSFDASGEEIYPALVSGATLVLIRSAEELVGRQLIEFCENHKVNVLHLPATVWHQVMDDNIASGDRIPVSYKLIVVGGDKPDLSKIKTWSRLTEQNIRFINAYGPTETTITATQYETVCSEKILGKLDKFPIGRPIPNVRTYILDKNFQPVPIGVPGELYIGGEGVARGYLNRPELTTLMFVSDPFNADPGGRLYRTGDLARYLPDGNIDFIGRVDYQVKIRGFRIELGEVESSLQQHQSVADVVVIAREDTPGQRRLVAYVVPIDNSITVSELGDFLRAQLPEYMVPSVFIYLDSIPLLPNGKVDRKNLPLPDDSRPDLKKDYIPASNRLEEHLVGMWQKILNIHQIGVHDNFFELGGNSILGATFINQLQDQMGEYIYLIAIFDSPTIRQLAKYLEKDYPNGIAKMLGEEYPAEFGDDQIQREKIDQPKIELLRDSIVTLPPRIEENGDPKNAQAAFILSAPRSGSTLLRVMLGGNPKLFAPPELQLLNYYTLEDQQKAFALERDAFWLDGTYQALMAIKDCDLEEAKQIVQSYRDQKMSTKQFFGIMQEWLGERLFVDKTPNYSLDTDVLYRIEEDFDNPLYIHLIRHPYGVIPSFEKARLHVFYPPFFKSQHPFTSNELAEIVWVISHQNILQFLESVPVERQYRILYEDMVTYPREKMVEVSRFLGVDYHPDMLQPQKNPRARMTEAIHPLAKMVGDVRFFEHNGIDGRNAYRWQNDLTIDYLGDVTWQMAELFGYDRSIINKFIPPDKEKDARQELDKIQTTPRDGILQLSYAQQRLWFLDHLEKDNPYYNIPTAVRLSGDLDIVALEKSLNEIIDRHEVLRTTFRTEDGEAKLVISSNYSLSPRLIDLSDSPEVNLEKEVTEQISDLSQKPFDLVHGPLLRVSLIKLGDHEFVAVLVMHHIVSDGWSIGVFIRELATLYQAYSEGKKSPLAKLQIQYVDYAHWQRSWLEGEILDNQLSYWREQLADSPPLLELPTDRARPRIQTSHGGRNIFALSKELSKSLKALSHEGEATLFMVMLSIFNILLFRYSGQDDILVGTPIANRNRAELENLIGFFVNTLVIRTDCSGNPSFKQLLKRVHKTAVEAFAHQDVPFEMLVDELQPHRDLSHTPLFQVMFVMQNAPTEKFELPGLTISPVDADSGTTKFDLTLSIVEREEALNCVLEFNRDLFDAVTIERMVTHFQRISELVVADPEYPIAILPFLTDYEFDLVVNKWSGTQRKYPTVDNITVLFERQVLRTPDEIAIIFSDPENTYAGNNTLTYSELNKRANKLAHYLQKFGIRPDTLVGVFLERSPEMIISLLGILKAGGAYLPLSLSYPRDRIEFMLDDSQAQFILTQECLLDKLPTTNARIICLDTENELIDRERELNPPNVYSPRHLAYIIYTSGTTGRSKGVLINQQSLINHALGMVAEYDLAPGDRVLQFITLSFDAAGEEIYPALLSGATLVLTQSAEDLLGSRLIDFCEEQEINLLHLPASIWHQSVDNIPSEKELLNFPLKVLLVGGESPDMNRILEWDRYFKHPYRFINAYGPTETTITTTIFEMQREDGEYPRMPKVPIGRPLPNTKVFILDNYLQPVPVGVPGELCIGGAGLARGYLHMPGMTSEKFVSDPFGEDPGARLYKTGDIARYLPDGNIEFVGRVDHQVKIRGFRIELGEIETTLGKHPGVQETIVVVREDTPGIKRLTAYFVPRLDFPPTVNEVRTFLQEKLPDYMVPAFFVELTQIPLLPNGKVDLRALPIPEQSRLDLEGEYIAPRSEAEKILAEIWANVLGVKQVGIQDNFFELGGDSILSIQVISRANQSGLRLTPKQLFQYPTIEGLASVAGSAKPIHADQGSVEGQIPLTPIQHWFFDLGLADPDHWNQSILVDVHQSLVQDLLRQTVVKLCEHHDALRITFTQHQENWIQMNANELNSIPFDWFDISASTESEQGYILDKEINKVQSSFNLKTGPLLRIAYFDCGDQRNDMLLMVFHHQVIDGVSWRIILEDFQTIYQQLQQSTEVRLPPKTTSFKYWSERLEKYANSNEVLEDRSYWLDNYSIENDQLPVDLSNGENNEASADIFQTSLNVSETHALLRDVPTVYGTNMNDHLLMALSKTLTNWSGSKSLLIDLEGHGREDIFEDVDLSRTVGWFTTVYPVNISSNAGINPGDELINIKEQMRKIPNNGFSFGLLRYCSKDDDIYNDFQALPEAEISFNYLGQVDQAIPETSPFTLAEESKGFERSPRNNRRYKLIISAHISQGRLKVNWSYSRNMYKRETIEKLSDEFNSSLRKLIEYCQSVESVSYTPSDFEDVDLSQDEINSLLEEIDGL